VVLAVALLAGFLFIGGAAAIYLSNPPGSAAPTDIALASGSPTLPPFVQPTATPSPSPTFILLPSESPSFTAQPTFSLVPTITPAGPTNTPGAAPVVAKFTCNQVGYQKQIQCQESSAGNVTGFQWDFGDDSQPSNERNPSHTYDSYGTYTVRLTVTSPSGATDSRTKKVTLKPEPTPTPTEPPATPTPTPSPSPSNTEASVSPDVTVQSTATPSPYPTGTLAP
jgi:PKD repeat protein